MEEYRPNTSSRPMTGQFQQESNSGRPPSRRRLDENKSRPTTQRSESRMGPGMRNGGVNERPMSKISRLQTASRPYSTLRPPSGVGMAGQVPIHTQVNVMDRPVTQQGISGLRTRTAGFGNRRVIHDKSYFMGILHTKMSEIGTEMHKLNGQVESLAKEQSTYVSYEKRVKELASELLDLQGELADYNLLSDLISSEKDKSFLEEELKSIRRDNKSESQRVEAIYNKRREAERQVADLEQKIQEEKNKAESLIQSLDPELRHRYEDYQKLNSKLQMDMDMLQSELDQMNARKEELMAKISKSEIKRRAAQLEEELLEAEEKRDIMARDAESNETPDEERERLLSQVKIDNSEISTFERQITDVNEELKIVKEELVNVEQEIEESGSERQHKYRELKKREKDIEEFMEKFEENKEREIENITKLEQDIMSLMEKITKNCHLTTTLPDTSHNFEELRSDLEFKEEEYDKAKYTSDLIESRNDSLKKQLNNFENLEDKMNSELKTLQEKMDQMKSDIIKYQDTESLKAEAVEKNDKLKRDIQIYQDKNKKISELLKLVTADHDKIKHELDQNEVKRQLTSLERKWANLEEINYKLYTQLKKKKAETDFAEIKENTLNILSQYNNLLQR